MTPRFVLTCKYEMKIDGKLSVWGSSSKSNPYFSQFSVSA